MAVLQLTAAARAVNHRHSHRESNSKPQTHEALAVVNSGLNMWLVMHWGGDHFLLGNLQSTEGILGIAGNSNIQLFQYSFTVYAGKWITKVQVGATPCITERV
jgi:hypothetical protein